MFVAPIVTDIKPAASAPLVAASTALEGFLRAHRYLDRSKIPVAMTVKRIDPDGSALIELGGRAFEASSTLRSKIEHELPLGLADYQGSLCRAHQVLGSSPCVCVEDGGNCQNMVVDFAILNEALAIIDPALHVPMAVASPGEPFARLPEPLGARLRRTCEVFPLRMARRFALHLPLSREGAGTLVLSSEATPSGPAVEALAAASPSFLDRWQRSGVVVAGDPPPRLLAAGRTIIINPPTALLASAVSSCFGTSTQITMNQAEAAGAARQLLTRGLDRDVGADELPSFVAPIVEGCAIPERLRSLDGALQVLLTYNPLPAPTSGPSYGASVTFGQEGGVIVAQSRGAGGNDRLACFCSGLPARGQELLDRYLDPAAAGTGRPSDVGAGDAAATVQALAAALDPRRILGAVSGAPLDEHAATIASLALVALLCRIAGAAVARSPRSYLPLIPEALAAVLRLAAADALAIANDFQRVHSGSTKMVVAPTWGTRLVVWPQGEIAA